MINQVVFNLYPFSENLYLPSANIVQTDKQGQLSHILQKAIPATLASYEIELTPLLQRMLTLIENLSPKALEIRFKPPKAKSPTPLQQLLADVATKSSVELYIYRELDLFLSEIVGNKLHLSLEAERKTMAKDVLVTFSKEDLVPHLSFRKTPEGVDYRLQLGTETEKWNISQHNVHPLTNTEPAWILVDYALFRVPGINGNMVRPFRQKDVIHIPPDKVRTYFRQFIAKNAGRTPIEAEGFAMETSNTLRATRLEPTENILEKTWFLKPVFEYEGAEFLSGERREQVTFVDFSGPENAEIVVRQVSRNAALETERLDFLKGMGLQQEGKMFQIQAPP